jgi:transcriptional regulator with XRE-family HTH domain
MYSIDFKNFRKANKMTQKDLADYFGVRQGFISQIEKGSRSVPPNYISKILADEGMDSSMVKIGDQTDEIKIPREVFDKISQLINTVCSQQETISSQQRMLEKSSNDLGFIVAHGDNAAGCAAAG